MNNQDFSDKNFRPTAFDDRPQYRFEDYENADPQQFPASYEPNQAAREDFNAQTERAKDEQQLNQLSLGFKIYAGINAFFSCIPFIHLFLGIMVVMGKLNDGKNPPPPAAFGWFFIVLAAIFISIGWAFSICNFYAGKFLKERRNYTFCFVMSCINCAMVPFGTVLGVFGIIILVRDSVKNIFQENSIK